MNSNDWVIEAGKEVFLMYKMKVIRKTRGGLWMCDLYGNQISIPQYMLRTVQAEDYMNKLPNPNVRSEGVKRLDRFGNFLMLSYTCLCIAMGFIVGYFL